MRVLFLRALGFVLLFGALAEPAEAVKIERIRHASGVDYTRVVIDVDGPTRFHAAMLPAGSGTPAAGRFYIDLSGTALPGRPLPDVQVSDGRVRRIRVGQHDPQTARVVIDLATAVRPEVFTLESPARVVIDLQAVVPPLVGPGSMRVASLPPASAEDARLVKARSVSAAVRPTRRRYRVIVDAGHGGKDPGAVGVGGIREKDVTMDVARVLSDKLRRRLNADVILTRSGDKYVSLAARKDQANRAEADLFVSIHANASDNRHASGVETYYLNNTDDRATRRLALLENGVDELVGSRDVSVDADLPLILSDMVQGSKEQDSILLADHIQSQVVRSVGTRYKAVRDLGVKKGPFYVLDGTYMPSVLVEAGFLTNREESARIGSTVYRELVAEGVYRGIRDYLEDDSVAGVY